MKKAALSSLGSIYFSKKEFNKSLDVYKQVIAEHPNTEEAANANEMLKAIYIEQGNQMNIDEIFTNDDSGASISREEQDDMMWAAAKKLYNDQKYDDALISLTNYLEKFPQGIRYIEANFYKAELNLYFEEKEEALKAYKEVANAAFGSFTEESILKAATIFYENEEWNEAYNYYERLYPISENKSTKLIAAIGRLRSAYFLENYDNAIPAATDIIENEISNEEQIREAHFKLAKSYYAKNNKIRALNLFESLSKEVKSQEGAESKYRIAEINYNLNRDSIAEELIYEFAQSNSPQAYWLGKAFILLAQIYYDSGDNFSAKNTLQTVINNYTNESDGVKDEASEKLNEIIDKEDAAKTEKDYLNLRINLGIDNRNDEEQDFNENNDFEVPKHVED
jgi:TolA-binding protein